MFAKGSLIGCSFGKDGYLSVKGNLAETSDADYLCNRATSDIGMSTAKKSIAVPIITAHTTMRKMSAAILISTGCIICSIPAYASPRTKLFIPRANSLCARVSDRSRRLNVQRRSLGSLQTDVASTHHVPGHNFAAAAFEIMTIQEGAIGVFDALLQTYLG